MMKSFHLLVSAAVIGAMLTLSPQADARRDNQKDARQQMRAGEIRPRSEIEANVVPRMRGMRYLGFSYDPDAFIYILRFIRGEQVVDVVVDARSGAILEQR